tara:strand:- start:478 stop:1236 length:759 start_codon:yes stop_codon:yes gene_type:complete
MKNLILMTNVVNNSSKGGGTHSYCNELYEYAVKRGKEWSNRIGCDFKCISDLNVFPDYSATWQRMAIFLDLDEYNNYDNIVYVDADLVISKNAPDIFQIMNKYEEEFFACTDYPLPQRVKTGYFNAGFIGVKKSLRDRCSIDYIHKKMKKYKNKNVYDQCCLNEIVKEKCDSYVQLSKSWNIFPPRDINTYSHFYGVHYVHHHKNNFNTREIQKLKNIEEKFNNKEIPNNAIKIFPESWKNTSHNILELEGK